MSVAELRVALAARLDPVAADWLAGTEAAVAADPPRVRAAFPAVGRRVGRGPLDPGRTGLHAWTVDDAGRAVLVAALGQAAGDELGELYRHGDAAERRGVLRALEVAQLDARGRHLAADLVADALRTNDLRLVAAALGPWGLAALDETDLAHAVLKCVFAGVPLAGIPGLRRRATPELARMLAAFAHERVAAGRTVPAEIWPLVEAHPPAPELAALAAERSSHTPSRRAAAEAALAAREAARSPAARSPAARSPAPGSRSGGATPPP